MTAINCFCLGECGGMMSDAAHYDEAGALVGFADKAYPIPGIDAVLAVRGLSLLAPWFVKTLAGRYADFDELMDRIEDDLRASYQDDLDNGRFEKEFNEYELYILGYSKTQGQTRVLTFCAAPSLDEEPEFTVGGLSIEPGLSDEEERNLETVGCGVGNAMRSGFIPEHHGVQIMEAQRRSKDAIPGAPTDAEVAIVGGHILMTMVREGSVTQRVIHRWNDEPGQAIEPESFRIASLRRPDAGNSSSPTGRRLNRKERLRLKAMQRKRAA